MLEVHFNQRSIVTKILVTTSSGGHLTLARAIAEDFKRDKIILVSSEKTKDINYVLPPIRKVHHSYLINPINLIINLFKSIYILIKEKPTLIINTGTSLGFSICFAGKLIGKKIIAVEPNDRLVPSKGIKLISWFADEIWLPQKELKKYYKKGKVIGLKFPKELYETKPSDLKKLGLSEKRKTIIVTTGSWGSQKIIDTIIELVNSNKLNNVNLIINTGKYIDPQGVIKKIKNKKNKYYIKVYIDNIYPIIKVSDLVITRAGLTPYEVLVLKRKMIMIPMEKSIDDHQMKTAVKFKKENLAEVILEKDLNMNILFDKINSMIQYNYKV